MTEVKEYVKGDFYRTWDIEEYNKLIKSGEWRRVIVTDRGAIILERKR